MSRYLKLLPLAGLALGLAAGCAAHKPVTPSPAVVPAWASLLRPVAAPGPRLDSVVVAPHRSRLAQLLGGGPAAQPARRTTGTAAVERVGKKATVNVYYGPATVSTAAKNAAAGAGATAATKAVAPVAGAGATSQDYRKQGQRGGAAASGQAATATTTTSQGLSWWWLLVPALGYLGWRVYKRFWLV